MTDLRVIVDGRGPAVADWSGTVLLRGFTSRENAQRWLALNEARRPYPARQLRKAAE